MTPAGQSCGHAIGSLQERIDCDGCLAEYDADCPDRAAVPMYVAPYPASCAQPIPD